MNNLFVSLVIMGTVALFLIAFFIKFNFFLLITAVFIVVFGFVLHVFNSDFFNEKEVDKKV